MDLSCKLVCKLFFRLREYCIIHIMPVAKTELISREQAKARTDAALGTYLRGRTQAAGSIGAEYERLWQSVTRLSSAGGKRLRPFMALLSYQVFTNENDDITAAATAWELLHLCMLIHDDFIDQDMIRYGVDNIAGEYLHIYEPLEADVQRRGHLANSAALLAGDVALSAAHDMILGSSLTNDQKVVALQYLTEATFNVAGGELLDTESVLYDIQLVDSLAIARHKTASYSFVGPLAMGADLGGASDVQLVALRQFALELGCAYQLIDDLLGVFGDASVTGKSAVGDIREGKRTFLMQQAYQRASTDELAILNDHLGKADITHLEADHVKHVLVQCGAKQAVNEQIDLHIKACKTALDQLCATAPRADELQILLDVATKRTY